MKNPHQKFFGILTQGIRQTHLHRRPHLIGPGRKTLDTAWRNVFKSKQNYRGYMKPNFVGSTGSTVTGRDKK